MCAFAEYYLKQNMITRTASVTLQGLDTVVMSNNPMRHALFLPFANAVNIFYYWGDGVNGFPVNGYTGNPPLPYISREDIGDVITYQFHMWCSTGTPTVRFSEISYDPAHFWNYERWVNDKLADISTLGID